MDIPPRDYIQKRIKLKTIDQGMEKGEVLSWDPSVGEFPGIDWKARAFGSQRVNRLHRFDRRGSANGRSTV
jgi:hypothetical protein